MNFIVVCLHCLDMRDFHSAYRETPFLDSFKEKCVFLPSGRAQGHHQHDSLNAEMTGLWTSRHCDSSLSEEGYTRPQRASLPKTLLEKLSAAGYELITNMAKVQGGESRVGTWAVNGYMNSFWLKDEPERVSQFSTPEPLRFENWIQRIKQARGKFYAHTFLRPTHRPWAQEEALYALLGPESHEEWKQRKAERLPTWWPYDARVARKAALQAPDEFAALRRKGLTMADELLATLFEETRDIDDVTFIIYSNHGEVYDHFRFIHEHPVTIERSSKEEMIVGTSHGPYPYEVLYSNMQMWLIPGWEPRTVRGTSRLIDFSPTVLELAGVPDRTELDGQSMLPFFDSRKVPLGLPRYAESHSGALSMVREDGLKLIACCEPCLPGHELAVFDLHADPYEYVNLIDSSIGQEMLAWAIKEHRELKQAAFRDG